MQLHFHIRCHWIARIAILCMSATFVGNGWADDKVTESGEGKSAVDQPVAASDEGALAEFVKLKGPQAVALVRSLVDDKEPEVRGQALALLVSLDKVAAIPALEKAIASKFSSERQQAWDTLASIDLPATTKIIEQGLADYLAGKQPPDVWLNVIEAAEGRVAASSIQALNRFEEELVANNSLEAYRDCAVGGNPGKGSELFFNKTELSCVRCHKVAGSGGEVGPDLSGIGSKKDQQYLLESIVEPDAKIAESFETVVLLTDEGQVISGILRKENETLIELIDAQGKIVRIDPEQVASRKKGKSSMPIDLLKHLTRRELRDLVAYLSSLKESP